MRPQGKRRGFLGGGHEAYGQYGFDQGSRAWCDARLAEAGFDIFPDGTAKGVVTETVDDEDRETGSFGDASAIPEGTVVRIVGSTANPHGRFVDILHAGRGYSVKPSSIQAV